MEGTSDPERGGNADVARDGVKSGVAIEFKILTRVEDIESGNPEGDGSGEQQDARIECTANGDPCGSGCNAQSETKNKMGKTCKALGIGVKKQNG